MGKASRRTTSEKQALQELPDKIDHEQHAEMIQQKFGIDPGKLAEKAIEKELR
jgi:hypothetical protein